MLTDENDPEQWFVRLDGWTTYCLLCNKVADDKHLASQTHQYRCSAPGARGRLVGEVRVAVITCTSSVWGCISVSVVVVLVSEQQQHVVEREGAEREGGSRWGVVFSTVYERMERS